MPKSRMFGAIFLFFLLVGGCAPKSWGAAPPKNPKSWGAAPPQTPKLGGLRPPKPQNWGGCAPPNLPAPKDLGAGSPVGWQICGLADLWAGRAAELAFH